jgi:hypothetical protein
MVVKEVEYSELPESEKIDHWRRERFKELVPDSPEEYIDLLSSTHDIAPSDLQSLLDKGCPPQLAIRILI